MVWSKRERTDEHKQRSAALTQAAYHGPAGMPVNDRSSQHLGSRGGAPIWVMREAWMAAEEPHSEKHKRGTCSCFSRSVARGEADSDGFAVFGRYPKGFLAHVLKLQLLGHVKREEILHVCSGTLGPTERWTVDLRKEARPRVLASGTALPFVDNSFPAVMMDPPYSDEYARNLYKVENPRPSWLLREAARVVQPGGYIGILHVAIPFSPPACELVNVYGISTGVGFRIRAFTVYRKEQTRLPL